MTNRPFGFRKRVQVPNEQHVVPICLSEQAQVSAELLRGRRTGLIIKPSNQKDEHGLERLSDFWTAEIIEIRPSDETVCDKSNDVSKMQNQETESENGSADSSVLSKSFESQHSYRESVDPGDSATSERFPADSSYDLSDLSGAGRTLLDTTRASCRSSTSSAISVRMSTATGRASVLSLASENADLESETIRQDGDLSLTTNENQPEVTNKISDDNDFNEIKQSIISGERGLEGHLEKTDQNSADNDSLDIDQSNISGERGQVGERMSSLSGRAVLDSSKTSHRSSSSSVISRPRVSMSTDRASVLSLAGGDAKVANKDELETTRADVDTSRKENEKNSDDDDSLDIEQSTNAGEPGAVQGEKSNLSGRALLDTSKTSHRGSSSSAMSGSRVSTGRASVLSLASGDAELADEDGSDSKTGSPDSNADDVDHMNKHDDANTPHSRSEGSSTSLKESESSPSILGALAAEYKSPDPDATKKLDFAELSSVSPKKRQSSVLDTIIERDAEVENEESASAEGCDENCSEAEEFDTHEQCQDDASRKASSAADEVSCENRPTTKKIRAKNASTTGLGQLKAMGRASYCSTDSYAPKSSRLSLIAPRPAIDSSADIGCTRQSARRKIPPLQFWRNERVEYARATGAAVPEIVDLVVRSPEPTPSWVRRRREKAGQVQEAVNSESADSSALPETDRSRQAIKGSSKRVRIQDSTENEKRQRKEPSKKQKQQQRVSRAADGEAEESAPAPKRVSPFFAFCAERRSHVVSSRPDLDVTGQASLFLHFLVLRSLSHFIPFRRGCWGRCGVRFRRWRSRFTATFVPRRSQRRPPEFELPATCARVFASERKPRNPSLPPNRCSTRLARESLAAIPLLPSSMSGRDPAAEGPPPKLPKRPRTSSFSTAPKGLRNSSVAGGGRLRRPDTRQPSSDRTAVVGRTLDGAGPPYPN